MNHIALPLRTTLLCGVGLALLAGCGHSPGAAPTASPDPAAAAADLTAADLQRSSAQPLEQLLMARVPGLRVVRNADGGVSFRIRGNTSIHGSNEPLVVLDGMPTDPNAAGVLAHLSPNDIDRIRVLRDPAETSMYGLRGANGVIVITTKRGGRD